MKNLLQIIFLALILLCCNSEKAQAQFTARGNYNFLDFQQKPYYFGITLGYNQSNYRVFRSEVFAGNKEFDTVQSFQGPGFNIGIVSNLKVGNYFDLRFLPALSFAERQLNYTQANNNSSPTRVGVSSVFVEMPFHVRYKSQPFNDMRLFVIGGVKYAFDVASDAGSRNGDDLVKISSSDFALEAGFGVQFFLPYFIFSPEIKFSHGLGNALIFDDNLIEASIIDKIISRTFTISFHFEG
ncbi:MAG: hypothetical protein ACI85O_000283 [Saprospiraceae bacterium]|jgi:hypothetical protein